MRLCRDCRDEFVQRRLNVLQVDRRIGKFGVAGQALDCRSRSSNELGITLLVVTLQNSNRRHNFFPFCEMWVSLEQNIAGTAPSIFFATVKHRGAAKNVVSVMQTIAGVTKSPYCAAEAVASAVKRFVEIPNSFASRTQKPGSDRETSPEVVHNDICVVTRCLSRLNTCPAFTTPLAAATDWTAAAIERLAATRESFLSMANTIVFVTETNVKIGQVCNDLIWRDLDGVPDDRLRHEDDRLRHEDDRFGERTDRLGDRLGR
jgi:hypothetical protein